MNINPEEESDEDDEDEEEESEEENDSYWTLKNGDHFRGLTEGF